MYFILNRSFFLQYAIQFKDPVEINEQRHFGKQREQRINGVKKEPGLEFLFYGCNKVEANYSLLTHRPDYKATGQTSACYDTLNKDTHKMYA